MAIVVKMPAYVKTVNRNPLVKTTATGGWSTTSTEFNDRNDALFYIIATVNYRREGYDYIPVDGCDLLNDDVIEFIAVKRKTTKG